MLSPSSTWATLGLLILGVKGSFDDDHKINRPYSSHLEDSAIYDRTCTGSVTVIDETTVTLAKTVPVTHYVDVTLPHYVNITISSTKTSTVCITESTTTTLHYTVSITETHSATITNTRTTTATVPTTITNTQTTTATVPTTITSTQTTTTTVPTTITNTQTTTTTVPATITAYTTQTVISTTVDPCPTTCSISAGTVTLFFWPTDRPYTYPPTYVDPALAYTFTSPSVYMLIDTARGTNTLGQPAGPSTTSWILALDLDEVSTIVDRSATRQLTLSDLGTDCPQTAEPSAIATMVDSRCNPILAAPKQVSSWAYPCNACGRFGLFDPPYAVPTLTGGLIEATTTAPIETTAAPTPTSTSDLGTTTSSPSTRPSSPPPSVVTASATRVKGGLAWLISGIFVAVFQL